MAEYLVLIYEDEQAIEQAGPDAWKAMMDGHNAFGEAHGASLRGGNALQAASTATSIRIDAAGTATITDGAFAETKEALGGYYVIEAADLDEAIKVASAIPAAYGGVEIRPIRTLG